HELDGLSDAFSVWLQEHHVKPGDRVGIILQNVPHFAIAALAAWKGGAIPVPGNPMYKADELARIFADYTPAAIVCHDDHLATVRLALEAAGLASVAIASANARDFQSRNDERVLPPRLANGAHDFLAICNARAARVPAEVARDSGSTGLILYTSGTTGVPKGAVISHSSLIFNAHTSGRWMHLSNRSRILGLAPLFHITGFVLHMAVGFVAGCSVALQYRFQPDAVLEMLRAYRPTFTIAAITAFNALMNAPAAAKDDFVSFEHVFSGGAPIAPVLREVVREKLGIELWPVYGMTESCSPTHIAPPGLAIPVHPEIGALSVGLPISFTDSRIAGPDGEILPPGSAGEIWMRGPQIMTGYWNKPEETAEALRDGWLRSGDVGIMDQDGWFYVIDRQKDMINASGFKVWPREVEDVLLEHPAIREAAVIGVPDSYRGETVHAFVSLRREAAAVDQIVLVQHCRARLAAYKVPRKIRIVDELPKTPTGKIQRAALRERSFARDSR
ncbi:MAG TPA: AMP-binding protein, partial [Novosphingobium sp.]|nr:AMP-binding protein [Novosphingobium sp.]